MQKLDVTEFDVEAGFLLVIIRQNILSLRLFPFSHNLKQFKLLFEDGEVGLCTSLAEGKGL